MITSVSVADVDEVEIAHRALARGRGWRRTAIDAADAHGADGTARTECRRPKRGGRAVDGEDVGSFSPSALSTMRDDLGVVEVTLREKRTQRAVGHAAGEDFLFGWGGLRA